MTGPSTTTRTPGCRCRQPGVAVAFHCSVHGLYPVARLSDEDRRAIAEDVAFERTQDAADRGGDEQVSANARRREARQPREVTR